MVKGYVRARDLNWIILLWVFWVSVVLVYLLLQHPNGI